MNAPARGAAASAAAPERIEARRLRAILIGSAGNLVEWYDFYTYAAFSLYFANSFFPAQDATAQMMSTAGIFALGFFIRPLGGLLFGRIADRSGRKNALMGSVLLMCLGSLIIACAPTYAVAGAWAPALLLLARLLQGLSLGGEYGSSATYLSEMATSKHRGFYASFQYVTLIGGQLTALLVLLVLQHLLLTDAQLRDWGWRIPFLIGAGLAVLALRMRKDLHETASFEANRSKAKPLSGLRQLAQHPREVLLVIGLTMGGTLAFYVYTTYMQKFLRLSVGLTDSQTTAVSAASLVFAMLLQPIYGALSDRVCRRPLLVGFALLGTIFTVPLLSAIRHPPCPRPVGGLWPDRLRLADRVGLHLDQCGGEGRVVPGRHPRHRGGRALCAGGVGVWRHGRVRGAVVQAGGAGERLLLVCHRRDRLHVDRVLVHARHAQHLAHRR